MGKVQKSLLRQTYSNLYRLKRPPGLNSVTVDDANHGHKADEGARNMSGVVGTILGLSDFARPLFRARP